jgi:hypothetical protein
MQFLMTINMRHIVNVANSDELGDMIREAQALYPNSVITAEEIETLKDLPPIEPLAKPLGSLHVIPEDLAKGAIPALDLLRPNIHDAAGYQEP